MYFLLFLLAAGLNIVQGWHFWPPVLAGSLNDPDSYMRLLRIEQGVRAGHLVVNVARDDSGAGVYVEWSRLLDGLLWLNIIFGHAIVTIMKFNETVKKHA